ncbi:hypothetical protein EDC01DRAFT_633483 [Geopyxis carbonaria]|nr:hypothetical protein EDC01DRAFT_633483 [Geopyxis carbonaria]
MSHPFPKVTEMPLEAPEPTEIVLEAPEPTEILRETPPAVKMNGSIRKRPGPVPGSKKGATNKDGTPRQKPGPKKDEGLNATTKNFKQKGGLPDIEVLIMQNGSTEIRLPGRAILDLRFKKNGYLKAPTGPKKKVESVWSPPRPDLCFEQVYNLLVSHNGWSEELGQLLLPWGA